MFFKILVYNKMQYMNFRFFDDLVNSLQKRPKNLGLGNENIKQKFTQQKLLKIFWKIYIKF